MGIINTKLGEVKMQDFREKVFEMIDYENLEAHTGFKLLKPKEIFDSQKIVSKKCPYCAFNFGNFGTKVLCKKPSSDYGYLQNCLIDKKSIDELDFCPDFSQTTDVNKLPKGEYDSFNDEVWWEVWNK